MSIQMTFKHMDSSEAVKSHVQSQTKKLDKFLLAEATINWVFYIEGPLQVADIHLKGKDGDYFGQSKTENLYTSIDQAVDKIEKQLKKHKDIVKGHARAERSAKKKAFGDGSEEE